METPSVVVASLENAPGIIIPLIHEVPLENRKRRPSSGSWSAHEHACHLAQVHPIFFQRLDLMLREPHPKIISYNPPQDQQEGALLRLDLDREMVRFRSDRMELVRRLRELRSEDWSKTADHEEYSRYSVWIMVRHLAMHDMLHAYRIEELLLNKSWAP